jgi:hypothetical protein
MDSTTEISREVDGKAAALAVEVKARMVSAGRKARLNYLLAYLLLFVGVLSSLAASIFTASGRGDNLHIAVLAAIPGFVVLMTNTFRFEARAEWWYGLESCYDRLHRGLEYEDQKSSEVSKAMTDFITETEKHWPLFGKPSTGPDHRPAS